MDGIEGAELATYCGLYCGACAIKNGQIRDTATALQGMLKAYSYHDWAPTLAGFVPATKHYPEFEGVLEWLTAQDCPGCLAGGGNPECAIRICAREKGFAGCWGCAEVTCEKLQEIDQGYLGTPENRQRICEIGLEDWLAEQAAKVEAGFSYLDVQRQQICRVISEYQSAYPDPLVISAGEELTIGEKESSWSGWVWCTNRDGKSRWVPEKYVERKGDICIALYDYEATELSVSLGEELIMDKEESGWIWCTNQRGQSGWVPADHVEKL